MKLKKLFLLVIAMIACLCLCLSACEWSGADDSSSSSVSDSSSQTGSSEDSGDSSSVEPARIYVDSVEMNANFVNFKANTAEKPADALSKRSEFIDRTVPYTVGDDNAFSFKPVVIFSDEDYQPVTPDSWDYIISVSVKEGDAYTLLEGADLDLYVESIDAQNCVINFSTDAVGKTFSLSVHPDELTDLQLEDIDDFTQTVEILIADGYNASSAKELAYLNNGGEYKDAWTAFKTANGLDAEYDPAAIILHGNISITANDVIPELFWTEDELGADNASLVGTLKDYADVYYRDVLSGDSFDLIGNYFTISIAQFPFIEADRDGKAWVKAGTSHSQFIRFHNETSDDKTGVASIKNLNLVGNAPRVEDTQKSGGLILVKAQGVSFTAENTISNGWFINYFPNYSDNTFIIDSCKAYDSFATLVYVWGCSDVRIMDSELIGAGGPAMIVDHVDPSSSDRSKASKVVATNSEIHSYVTGGEAWFSMYDGATSAATQIKTLDDAFNNLGRSFIKASATGGQETYLDFQALYKSGNAEGLTADKITGYLNINEAAIPMNFGTYGAINAACASPLDPYVAGYIDGVTPMGAPTIVTNAGGLGMIYAGTETGGLPIIAELNGQTPVPVTDPNNNLLKGDQLYLYYNYMGICLGYGNVGDKYEPAK